MFLLKFCLCAKQTFKLNCTVIIKFSVLLSQLDVLYISWESLYMKDVLLVAVIHTSEFKSKTIICYTLKLVLPNAFPGLKIIIVIPSSNPSLMLKL